MTLIQFDIGSGARIGKAVRFVENQANRLAPLQFDFPAEQARNRNTKVFRVCTFTGQWSYNTLKTVALKFETSTPNTVSALNLFCGLSPVGSCDASIAKDGTTWVLIQPSLTQLPGYSTQGTHVLTIQSANLRWIGTTAC